MKVLIIIDLPISAQKPELSDEEIEVIKTPGVKRTESGKDQLR